jgi:hypothetical protein
MLNAMLPAAKDSDSSDVMLDVCDVAEKLSLCEEGELDPVDSGSSFSPCSLRAPLLLPCRSGDAGDGEMLKTPGSSSSALMTFLKDDALRSFLMAWSFALWIWRFDFSGLILRFCGGALSVLGLRDGALGHESDDLADDKGLLLRFDRWSLF